MIRYGSVCSGIEAASVAWEPLGWQPAFLAEIDAFPASVLHHHHSCGRPRFLPSPDEPGISKKQADLRRSMIRAVKHLPENANGVPNYGDFTQIPAGAGPVDLLVGGTPCQSFSVAGKRLGLDDPRGNLALEHIRLAKRLGARWFVWENVPGVLSSSGGRDFADFLGFLSGRSVTPPRDGWKNAGIIEGAGNAYGLAWRVLDAQYVRVDGYARAVPQRRRRVFVVGYSGDWRRAAAVLFEPESMRGHHPPRREPGQGSSGTLGARPTGGGGLGTDFDLDGGLVAADMTAIGEYGDGHTASTLKSRDYKDATDLVAHTLRGEGFDASEDGTGRGPPLVVVPDVAATLTRGAESHGKGGYAGRRQEDDQNIVALALAVRGRDGGRNLEINDDGAANAILTPNGGRDGMGVGVVAIQAGATRENPASGPDGAGMQMDIAYTIEARTEVQAVAFDETVATTGYQGDRVAGDGDAFPALSAQGGNNGGGAGALAMTGMVVRRLMPLECARLQGFDDDHCMIEWKGRAAADCPDGPQYKAYGNSMAVNVMRWLGMRIDMMERLIREGKV